MRRWILPVVLATAALPWVAPAPASAVTVYTFSPRHAPSKCWDDPNFATANDVQIDIWNCVAQTNEFWHAEGDFLIGGLLRNDFSGKCLTVRNGSTSNSAPVIQYTCTRANGNGQWLSVQISSNGRQFVNVHSGKCLDVQGASTANGAKLIQYTCDSRKANQIFTFKSADGLV